VAETLLRVEDVHTYYGESYVLQGVSLSVTAGQVVALLGRNGMGKTTLIGSITGQVPARRGAIWFRDVEVTRLPPYRIAQLGIALVPQGRRIFRSLTVAENLAIPQWAHGRRAPGADGGAWDLAAVLAEFDNLRPRLARRAGSLSGGEQQMLAIGRALLANPDLLLMDEPSEGLAPLIVEQVKAILARLKQRGQAILLVEQNLDLALAVADFFYVLMNGQVVYDGTLRDARDREMVRAQYLGV
jgi:branched-chain amino acid transport system ATP-binding protein